MFWDAPPKGGSEMKKTLRNEIILFFHLLFRFHRRFGVEWLDGIREICCADCTYGESDRLRHGKALLEQHMFFPD